MYNHIDVMKDRLTDNYNKNTNSGMSKMLKLIGEQANKNETSYDLMKKYSDIDLAVGSSLDVHGSNIGIKRGSWTDYEYRRMIKVKIIANLSNGDIPTLNIVLKAFLGDRFLGVQETWSHEKFGYEPAGLAIKYHLDIEFDENDQEYLDSVLKFGGSAKFDGEYYFTGYKAGEYINEQLVDPKYIVKDVVAGGVRVYWLIPVETETSLKVTNDILLNLEMLATTNPLSNIFQSAPSSVKMKTNIKRTNLFSGSSYFDGLYNFDGVRDDFLNHNGEMRILKDGAEVEVEAI